MDECATNSDNCDVNAACQNSVGSYSCTCKSGYTGDRKICNGKDWNIKPVPVSFLLFFACYGYRDDDDGWWRRSC